MPEIHALPLFPLGLVLYPGARQPLHIFEERYKALAAYCLEEKVPFGIVLSEEDEMEAVGSTAEIEQVTARYDDGRLDVLVAGGERFRIDALHEEHAYLTADVQTLPDTGADAEPQMRERVITQHMKLLEMAGQTPRPGRYEGADPLSFLLAQTAGLEVQQQQRVLEMGSERERVRFLLQHFEGLLPRLEQQAELRRKVQSNGHFEDFSNQ